MTVFAHSQTTNKLVNEAANDFARVSGQDRKIPPALGTNQIAEFGWFRPLASLEKKVTYVLKVINCYFAPFSRLNLTLHIPDTFLFLYICHQFMLIFFAFDNDDIESSKRRVTFLSLILLLN